jgi:hypothetical protein
MSKALSNIFGSTGAMFVAVIDSGSIVQATLNGRQLTLVNNRSVVVDAPGLPAGDSFIDLRVVFGPGEPDANIGLGTVTSGTVQVQVPPGKVLNQFPVGAIKLFGE